MAASMAASDSTANAQDWVVPAKARLHRPMPASTKVTLLDVELESTDDALTVLATTTVEAMSGSAAIVKAGGVFESAAGASRIALKSPLEVCEISRAHTATPNAAGEHAGLMTADASASIVGAPVDAEAIAAAVKATETCAALPPKRKREVEFALRWYERAMRERDVVDRFVVAWVGLETACSGKGRTVENIVDALTAVYAGAASAAEINDRVQGLYKTRKVVFHEGALDEPAMDLKAQGTRAMLGDKLAFDLHVPTQNMAVDFLRGGPREAVRLDR